MKRKGVSLASLLMIISIAMAAAFALAALSTLHLNMGQRVSNTQTARHLAESVVNQTIAGLQQSQAGLVPCEITGVPGLPANSWGRLTFDAAQASSWGVPVSTNNADDTHPNGWNGRTVPPNCVHIVGTGQCRGVVRHVEALIHFPDYPVALASTGKLHLTNSEVAAVDSYDDVSWVGGRLVVDPDKLKQGDLATTSTGAPAITLDSRCHITGNVQAGGQVIPNGAQVDGEIRAPFVADVEMPDYDVAGNDPKDDDHILYETIPAGNFSRTSLAGTSRAEGSIVVSGDLNLVNAVLFVDGNLTVQGGLRGTGAVYVTGNTVVHGAVSLTAEDSVALMTVGDVSLHGDDRGRSAFQGLVYTRGSFSAEHIMLLGTFMADGLDGSRGNLTLDDCTMLYASFQSKPAIFKEENATVNQQGNPFPGVLVPPKPPEEQVFKSSKDPTKIGLVNKDPDEDGDLFQNNIAVVRIRRAIHPVTGQKTWAYTWTQHSLAMDDGDLWDMSMVRPGIFEFDRANSPHWPKGAVTIDYYYSRDEFLTGMSHRLNNHSTLEEVPDVSVSQARANLESALNLLNPADREGEVYPNFILDPNRFISNKAQARLMLWREF